MYIFSLEQEWKREIRARQKGDGSAMGLRRMHPPKMEACVLFFSLEQEWKREVVGANSRLIYRFVTHFWSPYRACMVYLFSLE